MSTFFFYTYESVSERKKPNKIDQIQPKSIQLSKTIWIGSIFSFFIFSVKQVKPRTWYDHQWIITKYLTLVIEGISEAPQRFICINAKGLIGRD